MALQKSLVEFEATIREEATKKNYSYMLKHYLTWSQIKDYDSILKLPDKKIYEKLIGYIQHLKDLVKSGNLSPNSAPKYFNGIEHFLIMNDRVFNWSKLHKMFPAKKKEAGSESYTTEQIQRILSFTKSYRNRFIILLFCSTGCRLGAIPSIKLGDVKKIEDCYYIKLYAEETEEAIAFLTPEASKVLDLYLAERKRDGEKFSQSSPLVREYYKIGISRVEPSSKKGIESVVYRLLRKAGIERVKNGTRYNIQADHGFRKWYKTQIAMIGGIPLEMSKKLIQHKDLEGKYTTPKPEQLFEFFKLAILNLTIDDSERLRARTKKLEAELSEKEKQKDEIQRLRQSIDYLLSKDPEAKKHLNLE